MFLYSRGRGWGGGGCRKAPRVSTLGSSNLTMTTILSNTFLLNLTIPDEGTADCEGSQYGYSEVFHYSRGRGWDGGGRKAPRVSTLGSSNLKMTTRLSDTFLLDLTILNKGTADCECSK